MNYLRLGLGAAVSQINTDTALPAGYLGLIEKFAAGTFNDDWNLLPPRETQTYSSLCGDNEWERGLGVGSFLVFARSLGGCYFCWNPSDSTIVLVVDGEARTQAFDFSDWGEHVASGCVGLVRPFYVPVGELAFVERFHGLSEPREFAGCHNGLRELFADRGFILLRSFDNDELVLSQFSSIRKDLFCSVQTGAPRPSAWPFDSRLRILRDSSASADDVLTALDELGWVWERSR